MPAKSAKMVLVVDDDPDIRDALGLVLRSEGYAVSFASDGFEALKRLQPDSPPPDVMLLDLLMPLMNGFELLDRLAKLQPASTVPIIVLSASRKLNAATLAVFDVLQKPATASEIRATLARALA